jgi:hypothetical protein
MGSRFLLLLVAASAVFGDVYMHNPRGSNNRLNERSANRNNGNRLFDSQNNNKGGYNVGDRGTASDNRGVLFYYEGSKIPFEWTQQHGCGGDKVVCQSIFQVMCDQPGTQQPLRDGTNTNTPTETTDNDAGSGLHETQGFYAKCKSRERNRGLFTADQNLGADRNKAINTRQNPGGTRRGLECPEERDYFPYWHPTPFIDIAVLTDEPQRCPMYQAESENVQSKGECTSDPTRNTAATCPPDGSGRGGPGWNVVPSWDSSRQSIGVRIPAPECRRPQWSRDNHLGNTPAGEASRFNWTVWTTEQLCASTTGPCRCILRLRYNISTTDYTWDTNSTFNGNQNVRGGLPSPVQQNPDVDAGVDAPLRLAMNTAQYGRTFQDRSHIFEVRKVRPCCWRSLRLQRPAGVPNSAVIHNINVRGKRGNIVQVTNLRVF